jgi:hypothetical protein
VKKVGFVGFRNALQDSALRLPGLTQKTMAPAMGCTQGNIEVPGNLTQRLAGSQGSRLIDPLATLTKPGQRCSGQGIEGFTTGVAFEPLQPIGMSIAGHMRA